MKKNFYLTFIFSLFLIIGISFLNQIGTYASTVGQQLVNPEEGWTRYDDSDENIIYNMCTHEIGLGYNPAFASSVIYYQGTRSCGNDIDASIKINYYGKNFRIISDMYWPYRGYQIKVTVDGIEEKVTLKQNEKGNVNDARCVARVVQYESEDLELGNHTVVIKNVDRFVFDAVDIQNGSLLKFNTEEENIINTAYAQGDNTNNGSGQCAVTFKGVAETRLSVEKTADVKEVWVGDSFNYTVVIKNTDEKVADSVIFKDIAPNHIDFLLDNFITSQGELDSSSTSKNILVNVGDIEPGETVTIKIPVNVVL